jgi:hypothetical protein
LSRHYIYLQKLENRPVYRRSIASIIMAPSVAFLPVVYANCCIGVMEWFSRHSFHLEVGARPVAVDASDAGGAEIRDLGHEANDDLWRDIVAVDQQS